MDLVRGAAVILVVLFHASPGGLTGSDEQSAWLVNTVLRPFRMPALLVLSGLLLQHSLSKGTRSYTVGKLRGIVWPWVLWMGVMSVLLRHNIGDDPIAFFVIGTHLWFLAVLMCSYALALVVGRIPAAVPAVVLFMVAGVLRGHSSLIPMYLWYSGFFFAGAALRPWLDKWLNARPLWPLLLGAVAVLGAAVQVHRGAYIPYRPDQVVISLAGVLALVWSAHRVPRSTPVRAVEWIGRDSIVTYLAHFPLLSLVSGVVAMAGLPATGASLISFVVVLGLCVLLTYLRPYTPWLYRLPTRRRQTSPAQVGVG